MADSIAIVIIRNKRFLLVKRKPEQEFYPRFWAPAHGHIRENESQEDAVKRFVKRTFGAEVKSSKFIKTVLCDYAGSNLHWWRVDIGNQKVETNKKYVLEHAWLTWSQLMNKNLLPATKKMFKNELKDLVIGKQKGKFVTVEGVDASGKGTQTKLLKKWLQNMGYVINHIAFPMYDTPFGRLVGKYLRGDFGSKEALPKEVALLYSLDRYHYAPKLSSALKKGEWVIADRYTQSNIGYQAGKYKDPEKRKDMAKWIEAVESRMPQPDLVVVLKINPEISRELHKQRRLKSYMPSEMKNDIHDEDLEYQKRAMLTYLEIAEEKPNWHVIDCMNDGELRPIEEIHADIKALVKLVLFS